MVHWFYIDNFYNLAIDILWIEEEISKPLQKIY